VIPNELKMEMNLDNVPFTSNTQLHNFLASTGATPEQVHEAERINTEVRLVALKVSFFTLALLALLAFFPAGGLPDYMRGEIPGGNGASSRQRRKKPVVVHGGQ
jgi:hypothetical protein